MTKKAQKKQSSELQHFSVGIIYQRSHFRTLHPTINKASHEDQNTAEANKWFPCVFKHDNQVSRRNFAFYSFASAYLKQFSVINNQSFTTPFGSAPELFTFRSFTILTLLFISCQMHVEVERVSTAQMIMCVFIINEDKSNVCHPFT